ncbi:PQQ-binding-like beta-propeller repeat protein [Streptomyces sp. NPDC052042]|uniref:outer membrane protein assembly factor BamB family protein n=1 Tax=Streptomyces sp. NPDC052042 TaxID=3365683 RepID=UPI0037D0CB8F
MTQPPQPPNEPPQGETGAPQNPPQGGFGAPTPPPADAVPPVGGAGAPQAPPRGGFGAPQAPQGGFGTPQNPPQGGFGAPTPPPADAVPPVGGYGAPQAPPQGGYGAPPQGGFGAPQNPQQPGPGYGYPPTQPGYGYPQSGAPQPGYGYPQGLPPGQPPQQGYGFPTTPMQQPPQPNGNGGGGKKFNTRMQIIVAASVAVVLIVGAGIWYGSSGGDDDKKKQASESSEASGGKDGGTGGTLGGGGKEQAPSDPKSKIAFEMATPKVTDVTTLDGSWLTDKAYVKTGLNEVVGYDAAKGTKLWSIPLAGQLCAASRHMSEDYKTAILFQEGKPTKEKKYPPCNQIGALDLKTGKLMWSKSVTAATSGDAPVRFQEVTVSGTTVAAGGLEGGAAFDLNTGAERWKPKAGADGCLDRGYGGGEGLAVVRRCGGYDDPQLVIQALNPTTGAPISSYKMPPGVDYASIVSTKPLVVAADVGDTAGDGSGISDFFSIDASTGKLLTRIAADADKYAARCRSTEVESCKKLAVGNNRIYVPTEDHEGTGEYGNTNEIVSFDLTTGKPTSDRADAGERYTMFPLRMDGGNIIAYKIPPYDKGGQIVSIDGGTFKQTVLMENPADKAVRDVESSFTPDYSEILYNDGHLYLSSTLANKRYGSLDTDRRLFVAFSRE